jgi:hypothetical protein
MGMTRGLCRLSCHAQLSPMHPMHHGLMWSRLLIITLVALISNAAGFPGEIGFLPKIPVLNDESFSLFDMAFCSASSTQFCSSSIYAARKWIEQSGCLEAENVTLQEQQQLFAMVDFYFSTGNTDKKGPLKDFHWLESGCNPCLWDGIFCGYTNSIETLNLGKQLVPAKGSDTRS